MKRTSYEKRVEKLVSAYQKYLCDNEEQARQMVKEAIEEDCIESVEQNVSDGLLCVDYNSLKGL